MGFTLAELLTALAILGVIATFTIPKILNGSQNTQKNTIAKEAAAMISETYQTILLNTDKDIMDIGGQDFEPYFNYVKLEPNGYLIDNRNTVGSVACSAAYHCARLHNGAVLMYNVSNGSFQQNATASGVTLGYNWFVLDVDGAYNGSTTGPGKAVGFIIYPNGVIRSNETMIPEGPFPVANTDPDWFSW